MAQSGTCHFTHFIGEKNLFAYSRRVNALWAITSHLRHTPHTHTLVGKIILGMSATVQLVRLKNQTASVQILTLLTCCRESGAHLTFQPFLHVSQTSWSYKWSCSSSQMPAEESSCRSPASLTLWSLKGLHVSKAIAPRCGGLQSVSFPEWPDGVESQIARPRHERQVAWKINYIFEY